MNPFLPNAGRKMPVSKKTLNEGLFSGNWTSSLEAFAKKFGEVAVASGESKLLHFANSLPHYADFMTNVDPVEFANHYVRQRQTQDTSTTPYRGGPQVDAQRMASTRLDNVANTLKRHVKVEPEFIEFAIEFFQDASNAASHNV